MSELHEYEVEVNGWPTTMQLSDADAALRGLTVADTVEHRAALGAWLAAEAEAQAAEAEAERIATEAAASKQATAASKSRTAANKGA